MGKTSRSQGVKSSIYFLSSPRKLWKLSLLHPPDPKELCKNLTFFLIAYYNIQYFLPKFGKHYKLTAHPTSWRNLKALPNSEVSKKYGSGRWVWEWWGCKSCQKDFPDLVHDCCYSFMQCLCWQGVRDSHFTFDASDTKTQLYHPSTPYHTYFNAPSLLPLHLLLSEST